MCVTDCRLADAKPCAQGTVCNVSKKRGGECVSEGSACVTSSAPEMCGSLVCGPGTTCDGKGQCYPRVPCASAVCQGSRCWGTECACDRIPACQPAPLGTPGQVGTLHDDKFRDTLADLKFDPQCGAWGVTLRSGPDYLRSISPTGAVTEVAGVTNLNMGEVGVLRPVAEPPIVRALPTDVDVALTYICCSTCGCQLQSTPQGVAHFEGDAGIPLVIPSTQFTESPGKLPFNSVVIDTGPEGLTYGPDRVLYSGNLNVNGDFYSFDLTTRTTTLVTTFASRVHSATPFDFKHLLVALEGGEVRLLRLSDRSSKPWTLSDAPVISMARDFFDGSVYIARADKSIWKYDGNGVGVAWQTTKTPARISIAPDGKLYALEIVLVGTPTIVNFALPTSR
jgi:hypothetical protein